MKQRVAMMVVLGFVAPQVAGGQTSDPLDRPPASVWTRQSGDDWPQFLGASVQGNSRETGIRKDWTQGKLPLLWRVPLSESYGMCSVAYGRVYQFDRVGDQARLICLTAEDGKELWRFEYPTDYEDMYGYNGGPRCSPLIDEGRVFIYGVEGMLHCLSAASGELVWKLDTMRRFGVLQNFFGVGSNPIIQGDLLWVMVGGSPPEDQRLPAGALDRARGNKSGLVAFDKRTGEVRRQFSDELASYASLKPATIQGKAWCFAFARGGLVGFDPVSGEQRFDFPWRARILESVNAATPVVVGDEVLITETYGPGAALLRVGARDAEVVWQDGRGRQKSLQAHWNTPVYHEGYVYASSGRHTADADLRCVQWKTGKVMWSRPGTTRCSLLGIDGCLIVLGERGDLYLIKASPEGYEEITRAEFDRSLLSYPSWAAPVVSHGLLFVRGERSLACFELIP